jgi:hypothetical protein
MFASLQFKLELKKEGKEKLIKLMHKQSSAIPAIYKANQYPTDKPVAFGSKRLFEKLRKNYLTGKAREKLKNQWRELRQGTLIAIDSKHKTAASVIGMLKYAPHERVKG